MMMNLFSSFDPSTNWNLNLNWISALIIVIMVPLSFWMIPSRLTIFWFKILIMLFHEFKNLIPNNKNSSLMFISLFSLILFNNLMGLFPFIFTSSSHLTFSLSLALPMWLSFMIYGWMNNSIHMLAHLVPEGTPAPLMPFMVCIETISNIIRPGTLTIRLMANMVAGHLLLTLMGNSASLFSLYSINIIIISQILLLILELAVAIIQSYVFAVLITLYSSEVN